MRRRLGALAITLAALGLGLGVLWQTHWLGPVWSRVSGNGKKSVADRLVQYGPTARSRLAPHFTEAGVSYPPARVVLVGLKQERRLEVYVADAAQPLRFVRGYDVLAASGGPGPKLREGDRQVPEGIYRLESLNPNSRFHLSLRLDYPNAFDREQARRDGRTELGSDIMIHGNRISAGCLAMGDEAAEDLFVLAADVGIGNVKVILVPHDLRRAARPGVMPAGVPEWVAVLYEQLAAELEQLPRPLVAAAE